MFKRIGGQMQALEGEGVQHDRPIEVRLMKPASHQQLHILVAKGWIVRLPDGCLRCPARISGATFEGWIGFEFRDQIFDGVDNDSAATSEERLRPVDGIHQAIERTFGVRRLPQELRDLPAVSSQSPGGLR
jgi:hypothetical protein